MTTVLAFGNLKKGALDSDWGSKRKGMVELEPSLVVDLIESPLCWAMGVKKEPVHPEPKVKMSTVVESDGYEEVEAEKREVKSESDGRQLILDDGSEVN